HIDSWSIAEYNSVYPIAQGHRDPLKRLYFFFKEAKGYAIVDDQEFKICPGTSLVIPVNRLFMISLSKNPQGYVFAGDEYFLRTKVALGTFTPPSHYKVTYHHPRAYY